VTAVLITGMSGTGKSTVLAELARRGHTAVDTDQGGWIVDVPQADGSTEPLWNEARIATLLDEHMGGTLFVTGCAANQGRFYDRFHAVVLLSVPEEVMLERIATRTTNEFGKREEERRAILGDVRAVEPLLRAGATFEIDTRAPVAQIADRLEAVIREPGQETSRRARDGGPSGRGGS
jgi:adenylate kinase family enzyme